MATTFNDFGGRGGLVPMPSGSNALATQMPKPLMSKDIGDIIIKSFETVTEALSGGDVPVNMEQIEKAVTKGINKSILAKGNYGKGGSGSSSAFDKAEEARAKKFDAERELMWKKYLDRREKEDKEERKRREADIKEKVDKAFAEINTWSSNPLKGFSDTLDKGIKGFFTKTGSILSKTIWSKDITVGKKSAEGSVSPSSTSVTSSASFSTSNDIDSLVEDDQSSSSGSSELVQSTTRIEDMLDYLIQDDKQEDKKEEKKEQIEEQEKRKEKKDNDEKYLKLSASVGGVLLGVGVVAATLPILIGFVSDMVAKMPLEAGKTRAKIVNLMTGPNSIGHQITTAIETSLFPKLAKTPWFKGLDANQGIGSNDKSAQSNLGHILHDDELISVEKNKKGLSEEEVLGKINNKIKKDNIRKMSDKDLENLLKFAEEHHIYNAIPAIRAELGRRNLETLENKYVQDAAKSERQIQLADRMGYNVKGWEASRDNTTLENYGAKADVYKNNLTNGTVNLYNNLVGVHRYTPSPV